MKPTFIVLFAAAAQAGVIRNQARGNMLANCDNIRMGPKPDGDFALGATCGESQESVGALLDECIANDNGRLVWQKGGHFSKSCNMCKQMVNTEGETAGLYLQCRCNTKSGSVTQEDMWSFNLDQRLSYKPGVGGEQGMIVCNI